MATTIKLKNGSGAPLAGDLVQGEPALDLTNKRLYTEDSGGTVIEVGTNPSTLTVDTNTLAVDASNNRVGIGTTSPAEALNIVGTGGAAKIRFDGDSSNLQNNFIGITGYDDLIIASDEANSGSASTIQFRVDATERMRIDSSGRVGIGNTNPSYPLEVTAAGSVLARLSATDSNQAYMAFTNSTTGGVLFTDGIIVGLDSDESAVFYNFEAQPMRFGTSGSERMRIHSGGDVSIGTSTAGVAGLSIAASKNLGWTQSNGESLANMFRQTSSGALVIGQGYQQSATASGFASSYSSSLSRTAAWFGDSIRFYTDAASTVAAGTDITPTERMRIDSSGNLLVGTTSQILNEKLGVNQSTFGQWAITAKGVSDVIRLEGTQSSGTTYFNYFIYNGSAVGSITSTGSGTAYNPSSDVRLKENIRDYDNALADVMKLKPRKYSWKINGEEDNGFIAQELLEIPEFVNRVNPVSRGDDPIYGVDYMKFVTVLTGAIQEQQAMIETLQAEVAALKGA